MDIVGIGGGPAGLYFAILAKKAFPAARIRVLERNRADDTFGWGVVFSRETLDRFAEADPESFASITAAFTTWEDIETFYGGACTVSRGHGFCGFSRRRLLEILQGRARDLGVELEFQRESTGPGEFPEADLVVAADGANSRVREAAAAHFRPEVKQGKCRFSWLGTDLPLRAFTFVFRENEHGLFQVHAYPFEKDRSTWIVECREETWRRAGLDRASEEATVAYMEALFAPDLKGHRLLSNRSLWRAFPTVSCGSWSHGKTVLLGDAAHTAHFSIGSGTKLAMEDAIELARALRTFGAADIPAVLRAYEEARRPEVIRLQRAARTSQAWFEESARYMKQTPLRLSFNLMTRSKRITFDNLRARDPALVARVTEEFRETAGAPKAADGSAPAPAFTPFRLQELVLPNRIVVSPMCMYSAVDGTINDWHLVHLGSRAVGGAGLVFTEMTDVSAEGRITAGCAGMYRDEHVGAWRRVTDFVHARTPAKIGIQLAHAGRKGSAHHPWGAADTPLKTGGWTTLAPSALPWNEGWPAPKAMDRDDMDRVRDEFVQATLRSVEAGFDLVELHMAHGYLLSSFLTPLSNRRTDDYGGPLENRARFPLEVLRAVREAWPEKRPISVRVSATDWVEEGGVTPEESVAIALLLKDAGCDVVDVSSGGTTPRAKIDLGRMYQVPFADRIRHEAGIPVMTVGAIQGWDHANTVLAAGRADLVAMARPHLGDPYLTLHAAEACGYHDQWWPPQYLASKPRPPKPKA